MTGPVRPGILLAGALVLACVMSGCAPSATTPVENYPGTPNDAGEVELDDGGFGGAWLDDGASFGVTVSGSSTCPPIGSGYAVTGGNAITVTLETIPADKACTADFGPHTTVFRAASELESDQDLTVTVNTETFTIPALP
ncbi:hypothetical protein IWX78_001710 [Mycetocola sp. CAN_C7]|uniref:hypothetical protein n=1 Tax=Mycetocola sp. CAN_C7 TaxID=2787724 RepID=UPI0018C96389